MEEIGAAAAVQLGEDVVKEKDGEIATGFLPADGARAWLPPGAVMRCGNRRRVGGERWGGGALGAS